MCNEVVLQYTDSHSDDRQNSPSLPKLTHAKQITYSWCIAIFLKTKKSVEFRQVIRKKTLKKLKFEPSSGCNRSNDYN